MATKVNPYDPEVMRSRFWDLDAQIKACDEELVPLQAEAEEISNYKIERERELVGLLKIAHQKRYELQVEQGRLANALSGKTGESGDKPYDAEAVQKFHTENPSTEAEAPVDTPVE